jgi:hypothetical protein
MPAAVQFAQGFLAATRKEVDHASGTTEATFHAFKSLVELSIQGRFPGESSIMPLQFIGDLDTIFEQPV